MPIPVDVEGAAGRGKLDKKVTEIEEDDINSFYFNSRSNWKSDPYNGTSPYNQSGYSDIYFKYDYSNEEKEEKNVYQGFI